MRFYHSTSPRKWRQIKKLGFVASPEKLISLGIIKRGFGVLDDETSSGELDKEFSVTKYVFGTPYRQFSFGDICLEFELPEELVTANPVGDHLHWVVGEPDYYFKNLMPGAAFAAYWQKFQEDNPEPSQPYNVVDGKVVDNRKNFFRHFPELMMEEKLPLTFLVRAHSRRKEAS